MKNILFILSMLLIGMPMKGENKYFPEGTTWKEVKTYGAKNDTVMLVKTLQFEIDKLSITPVKCENDATYCKLEYEDFDTTTEEPGVPELPMCFLTVSLPLDVKEYEIELLGREVTTIDLDYPIMPVQIPEIPSIPYVDPGFTEPNEDIYSQDEPFPAEVARLAWTLIRQGVENNIVLAIYPIVYLPSQNKIEFAQSLSVSVNYPVSGLDDINSVNNDTSLETRPIRLKRNAIGGYDLQVKNSDGIWQMIK